MDTTVITGLGIMADICLVATMDSVTMILVTMVLEVTMVSVVTMVLVAIMADTIKVRVSAGENTDFCTVQRQQSLWTDFSF